MISNEYKTRAEDAIKKLMFDATIFSIRILESLNIKQAESKYTKNSNIDFHVESYDKEQLQNLLPAF